MFKSGVISSESITKPIFLFQNFKVRPPISGSRFCIIMNCSVELTGVKPQVLSLRASCLNIEQFPASLRLHKLVRGKSSEATLRPNLVKYQRKTCWKYKHTGNIALHSDKLLSSNSRF